MLRNTAPAISTIPEASATQARRLVLRYSSPVVGCMIAKISLQLELLPSVPAGPSMVDVKVDLTSDLRQGIFDE